MAFSDNITTTAVLAASALGLPEMDGAYFLLFLGGIWILLKITTGVIQTKNLIFPPSNPPLNEKYQRTSECDKRCDANLREHEKLQKDIHDAIDKLAVEMRELIHDLNEKSEARAKAYHDRVNPIEADVSALKSSEKSHSAQIYNLENRFNAHIEKSRR